TTDFRALCADLLRELDHASAWDYQQALKDQARTALAEPEPEGMTDEELLELMPETMRDEFSYASKACSDATGGQVKPRIFRVCLNTAALEYARAVLARWGTSNLAEIRSSLGDPSTVEGLATAEILRRLRTKAATEKANRCHYSSTLLTRAADLLKRLSPPQPVPVSERLPEEPLAWWFTPEGDEDYGWWVLEPDGMERCPQPTHWLPAHALPMPIAENE
ncbi:MAG: hypothetical protein VKM92_00295, partial [Cyanobacteriota bacterium]|nr:hypothetical protein [Cyanobacteriota bacterium]